MTYLCLLQMEGNQSVNHPTGMQHVSNWVFISSLASRIWKTPSQKGVGEQDSAAGSPGQTWKEWSYYYIWNHNLWKFWPPRSYSVNVFHFCFRIIIKFSVPFMTPQQCDCNLPAEKLWAIPYHLEKLLKLSSMQSECTCYHTPLWDTTHFALYGWPVRLASA